MGMANCKIYDSIDMNLLESENSESVLSSEKNIKNGIVTAWKNNIASALIDKTYGWSTDATTLAFNSYNAIQAYGSEQGTTSFEHNLGTYSPRKSCISLVDSAGSTTCVMFSTAAAVLSTNAIAFIGYLNGVATTIISGTLGIITSYDYDGASGNGAVTWSEQFATFSGASLTIAQYQTLKITWTITLTG